MWRFAGALALAISVQAGATDTPPAQILFRCSDDTWSVTLYGTGEGRLLLETRSTGAGTTGNVASSWDEVREGYVRGQGGGHQGHLRLFDGFRQIILFAGEDGELADQPGRTYAGALTVTERNPQQDFAVTCMADETNTALLGNVRAWAERTGAKAPAPEEEGGPFDAWF